MGGATSSSESSSEGSCSGFSPRFRQGLLLLGPQASLCLLRRRAPRTQAATAQADAATKVTVRVVLRPHCPLLRRCRALFSCALAEQNLSTMTFDSVKSRVQRVTVFFYVSRMRNPAPIVPQ